MSKAFNRLSKSYLVTFRDNFRTYARIFFTINIIIHILNSQICFVHLFSIFSNRQNFLHFKFLSTASCVYSFIYSSINGSTAPIEPWLLLQFRNLFYTDGRTPWTSDQLVARPRYLHTGEHKDRLNAHTDIHASSGIRTHDPSVRANEDSSCLRPATVMGTPLCVSNTFFCCSNVSLSLVTGLIISLKYLILSWSKRGDLKRLISAAV
jgi:hypothetical protein